MKSGHLKLLNRKCAECSDMGVIESSALKPMLDTILLLNMQSAYGGTLGLASKTHSY